MMLAVASRALAMVVKKIKMKSVACLIEQQLQAVPAGLLFFVYRVPGATLYDQGIDYQIT